MNNTKVIIGTKEYTIFEDGRIVKRRGKGFVKPFPDKDGYLRISVGRNKGQTTYNESLHRIMYRAFVGEIPEGMSVDHIDNNRLNNHPSNLQLMTMEENAEKGNAKDWLITDPSGNQFTVTNLVKFCRENNLHNRHIVTHSYKKWKAVCIS